MIHYKLQCANEHTFESSFNSISAYEKLEKAGVLECPCCGSHAITRAPMAPAIARGGKSDAAQETVLRHAADEVAELHRQLQEKIADVGDDFPDEARALHRGDRAARRRYRGKVGLVGRASEAEATALSEEGVPVTRLRPAKYDA